jgi:delta 1-pyrroline-5-carboxylate dehydrogenase
MDRRNRNGPNLEQMSLFARATSSPAWSALDPVQRAAIVERLAELLVLRLPEWDRSREDGHHER